MTRSSSAALTVVVALASVGVFAYFLGVSDFVQDGQDSITSRRCGSKAFTQRSGHLVQLLQHHLLTPPIFLTRNMLMQAASSSCVSLQALSLGTSSDSSTRPVCAGRCCKQSSVSQLQQVCCVHAGFNSGDTLQYEGVSAVLI